MKLKFRHKAKYLYNSISLSRRLYINRLANRPTGYLKLMVVLIIALTIYMGLFAVGEVVRGNYPIYGKAKAGAICNDGWRSSSHGQGTCSWHGGVREYITVKYVKSLHISNPAKYYKLCYVGILLLAVPLFISKIYRYVVTLYFLTIFYWFWLAFIFTTLFVTKLYAFLVRKVGTEYDLYKMGKKFR